MDPGVVALTNSRKMASGTAQSFADYKAAFKEDCSLFQLEMYVFCFLSVLCYTLSVWTLETGSIPCLLHYFEWPLHRYASAPDPCSSPKNRKDVKAVSTLNKEVNKGGEVPAILYVCLTEPQPCRVSTILYKGHFDRDICLAAFCSTSDWCHFG